MTAAGSRRLALGIEYRGTAYQGWETQRNGPTVQAALDAALGRVADHPVRTTCAGRTDSGVHAFGQVVHFDTTATRPDRAWTMGVNTHLPDDVVVHWVHEVPDDFSARFSATARRYRYIILNRRTPPAVLGGLVTCIHAPLDAGRMHRATQRLVGRHDFTAYRAAGCQARSPVRTISGIGVQRVGDQIALEVEANAFLHHMVRNIVGVLLAVGRGERPEAWVTEVLESRDRRVGGVTAPPTGLYLMAVRYPEEFCLPAVSAPGALW